MRQVRLKTYPSMVLVPSLYKIGCGSAAADEKLRFSLGAFHHHSATTRQLRLSSLWAHKIVGDEGSIVTLFWSSKTGEHSKGGRRDLYADTM